MRSNETKSFSKRPWVRRQVIINPKFQFTLIGYVAVMAVAIIGVLYFADLYFFKKFAETGKSLGLPETHIYFQFLSEQKQYMTNVFAIVSLVIFSILAVGGAVISHRIAGPVYRLCKHMEAVADGKTTRDVNFRKHDFFPEMAEAFNRTLKRFRDNRKDNAA